MKLFLGYVGLAVGQSKGRESDDQVFQSNQGYNWQGQYNPNQSYNGQMNNRNNQGYNGYNNGYNNQGYNNGYNGYQQQNNQYNPNRPYPVQPNIQPPVYPDNNRGPMPDDKNLGSAATCFAEHVDIDGNLFKTNVVANLYDVPSSQKCQQECQHQNECEYFVYEAATRNCDLYHDMENIEYDEDDDELKIMGPSSGCLPCYKSHWDYVQNGSGHNLVGYGAVYGVKSTTKCSLICSQVPECAFWSHNHGNQRCYLKSADGRKGLATDYDYNSGAKNCITANCIRRGKNYEDGYFTSYNVIGNGATELIPGVTNPEVCQSLCQLVDACTHWTLDQDDQGCFLVDSPEALEFSDDKISGPKSCDIK